MSTSRAIKAVRVIEGSDAIAPIITTQPDGGEYDGNTAVTLTVAAHGSATLTYQWYRGLSGDDSDPITGATASTYDAEPTANQRYWCRVTNDAGSADSADTLVWPLPLMYEQGSDAADNNGTYRDNISVTLAAGKTYEALMLYEYDSTGGSSIGPLHKWGTLPSSATALTAWLRAQTANTGIQVTEDGTATTNASSRGTNIRCPMFGLSLLYGGSGGTATTQHVRNSASGNPTVTVRGSSRLILRELEAADIDSHSSIASDHLGDWKTLRTQTLRANKATVIRGIYRFARSGAGGVPQFRVDCLPDGAFAAIRVHRHSNNATTSMTADVMFDGQICASLNTSADGTFDGIVEALIITGSEGGHVSLQFASAAEPTAGGTAANACTISGAKFWGYELSSASRLSAHSDSAATTGSWTTHRSIVLSASKNYWIQMFGKWQGQSATATNSQLRANTPPSDALMRWQYGGTVNGECEFRSDATATDAQSVGTGGTGTREPSLALDAVMEGGAGDTVLLQHAPGADVALRVFAGTIIAVQQVQV